MRTAARGKCDHFQQTTVARGDVLSADIALAIRHTPRWSFAVPLHAS